jgi:hypothetical protein
MNVDFDLTWLLSLFGAIAVALPLVGGLVYLKKVNSVLAVAGIVLIASVLSFSLRLGLLYLELGHSGFAGVYSGEFMFSNLFTLAIGQLAEACMVLGAVYLIYVEPKLGVA